MVIAAAKYVLTLFLQIPFQSSDRKRSWTLKSVLHAIDGGTPLHKILDRAAQQTVGRHPQWALLRNRKTKSIGINLGVQQAACGDCSAWISKGISKIYATSYEGSSYRRMRRVEKRFLTKSSCLLPSIEVNLVSLKCTNLVIVVV